MKEEGLEVMRAVKILKMSYLRHVMRIENYELIQLIFQGRIESKRS